MREHLLVDPDSRALTGLFDFEPAMRGARAYGFVAVAVFVACGDRRLLARIMAAYGCTFDPRCLLAHAAACLLQPAAVSADPAHTAGAHPGIAGADLVRHRRMTCI